MTRRIGFVSFNEVERRVFRSVRFHVYVFSERLGGVVRCDCRYDGWMDGSVVVVGGLMGGAWPVERMLRTYYWGLAERLDEGR